MSYAIEARCPCCHVVLDADILVRCEGHGEHEIILELAPAEPIMQRKQVIEAADCPRLKVSDSSLEVKA